MLHFKYRQQRYFLQINQKKQGNLLFLLLYFRKHWLQSYLLPLQFAYALHYK